MPRARQQQENRPRRGFAIRLDPALLVMTVLVMVLLRTFPAYALAPEDIVWGGRWMVKTEARFAEGRRMTLDASASVRIQARTATYPWRAFLDGRVGLEGPVIGPGRWGSDSELHRLYVRRYFPQGQLSLGKQFVNWGVGYAFAPTDVFNPPDPADPSAIRPGIVAATVQWSVGPLDYWHVAVAEKKYGIRRRGNVKGTDWSLLAVSDDGQTILGADFDGDLGIGWHAAAAYRLPKRGGDGLWHALVGADYSWLEGRLIWLGEYAFQTPASSRSAAPSSRQLFQQLTYRPDEFTSLFASVLYTHLPEGRPTWNVGADIVLDPETTLRIVATLYPRIRHTAPPKSGMGTGASPSGAPWTDPSSARLGLRAELSRAF